MWFTSRQPRINVYLIISKGFITHAWTIIWSKGNQICIYLFKLTFLGFFFLPNYNSQAMLAFSLALASTKDVIRAQRTRIESSVHQGPNSWGTHKKTEENLSMHPLLFSIKILVPLETSLNGANLNAKTLRLISCCYTKVKQHPLNLSCSPCFGFCMCNCNVLVQIGLYMC